MNSLIGGVLSKTRIVVVFYGLLGISAIAWGYGFNLPSTFEQPFEMIQNPLGQTVLSGSNVTLSVAATGAQPLGYQWFKNGQPSVDGGGITGSATVNSSITNCGHPEILHNRSAPCTDLKATNSAAQLHRLVRQYLDEKRKVSYEV
jgi:hypothetical protein